MTLYAFLADVAAIFRLGDKYFISRVEAPEKTYEITEIMVMSFMTKWGYTRTKAIKIDPAKWPACVEEAHRGFHNGQIQDKS